MTKSRTDRLQSFGTILALVISVIAMVTSIYEANIMKSQQKAMVWPYLKTTQSYSNEGFNIKVFNNGIGPALVKSVEVSFKNHPLKDIDELLDSLKPDRTFGYDILKTNDVNNYVFKPGEEQVLMGLSWTDETRDLLENLQYVNIKIAYESVLGDYWVYDARNETNKQEKFKARLEYDN
ncbi:hypothetical protein [Winogradskyella sp.]|uniref:hypothetical protein n=1 Tax=Winogradskyella sp. TaxID=1883156 RepID=UPI0026054EED|nr:hypothetical protein [Winogradskyella sp.]